MCLEFQNAQFRFKTTGGLAPNCYVTSLSHAFFPKNQKKSQCLIITPKENMGIDMFHGNHSQFLIPASITFPSTLIQILENDSWRRGQKAKAHEIQL